MEMKEFTEKYELIFKKMDEENKNFEELEEKYDRDEIGHLEYEKTWTEIWKRKMRLEDEHSKLIKKGFVW